MAIFLLLILGVQLKTLANLHKLNDLVQQHAMEFGTIRNTVSTELGSIQPRLEEALKQQASVLASVQLDWGALNQESLRAAAVVSVTPKEVTGDTRVRVQCADGEIYTLEKKGVTFTGPVWFSLFEEADFKVLLEAHGVTTVEEPELFVGAPQQIYLPTVSEGQLWYFAWSKGKDGTLAIRGAVFLNRQNPKVGDGSFQSFSLRCTVDGKELWNKPLAFEKENENFHVEYEALEKKPEQRLDMVLLATDSHGLIYQYCVAGGFPDSIGNQEGSVSFYLSKISKQDGTILYDQRENPAEG